MEVYEALLAKYGRETHVGSQDADDSARWVREHMIGALSDRLVRSIPVTDDVLDFFMRHLGSDDRTEICKALARLLVESDRRTDILGRLFEAAERDGSLRGPLWETLQEAFVNKKMKLEPEWTGRLIQLYDAWIRDLIGTGVNQLSSDRYSQDPNAWDSGIFVSLLAALMPTLPQEQQDQLAAAVLAHLDKGFVDGGVVGVLLNHPNTGEKIANAIARVIMQLDRDMLPMDLIRKLGPNLTIDVMDRAWARFSGQQVILKGSGLTAYLDALMAKLLQDESLGYQLKLDFNSGHWRASLSEKLSGVLPCLLKYGAENTQTAILGYLDRRLSALVRKLEEPKDKLTPEEEREYSYLIHVLAFSEGHGKVRAIGIALDLYRRTAQNELYYIRQLLIAILIMLGDDLTDDDLDNVFDFNLMGTLREMLATPAAAGQRDSKEIWRGAVRILGFWGTLQSCSELIHFWEQNPEHRSDSDLIEAMARSGVHREDLDRALTRAYFGYLRRIVPADGTSFGNYGWVNPFGEREYSESESGMHEVFMRFGRFLAENPDFRNEALAVLAAYPLERQDIKPDAVVLLLALAEYADRDARITPVLQQFAASPHPALQLAALRGLQHKGKREEMESLFLEKLKNTTVPEAVRDYALEYLRQNAVNQEKFVAALLLILAEPPGKTTLKFSALSALNRLLLERVIILTPELLDLRVRLMTSEKEKPVVRKAALEGLYEAVQRLPDKERAPARKKLHEAINAMINDPYIEIAREAWLTAAEMYGLETAVKTILDRIAKVLEIDRPSDRIRLLSRELSCLQEAFLANRGHAPETVKMIDRMHTAGFLSDSLFAMAQVIQGKKKLADFVTESMAERTIRHNVLNFLLAYREHYYAGSPDRPDDYWGDLVTSDFMAFLENQTSSEKQPFRLAILINILGRISTAEREGDVSDLSRLAVKHLQEESFRSEPSVQAAVRSPNVTKCLLDAVLNITLEDEKLVAIYNWLFGLDPAGVRASVEGQYAWSGGLRRLRTLVTIPEDWKEKKRLVPEISTAPSSPGIDELFEKPLPGEETPAVPEFPGSRPPNPDSDLIPRRSEDKKPESEVPASRILPDPFGAAEAPMSEAMVEYVAAVEASDRKMADLIIRSRGPHFVREVAKTLTDSFLVVEFMTRPDSIEQILAMMQVAAHRADELRTIPLRAEGDAVVMTTKGEIEWEKAAGTRAEFRDRLAAELNAERLQRQDLTRVLDRLRQRLARTIAVMIVAKESLSWTRSQVKMARGISAAFLAQEIVKPLVVEQEIDPATMESIGNRAVQVRELNADAQAIGDMIMLKPNLIVRVSISQRWMGHFETLAKSGRLPIAVVLDRSEGKILIHHKKHKDVSSLMSAPAALRLTSSHFSRAEKYCHTGEDAARVPIIYREAGTLSRVLTAGVMAATLKKELLDALFAFEQSMAKVRSQAALGTAGALMMLLAAEARRTNSFAAAA